MLSDFIERDKSFDHLHPSEMPKRVLLVATTQHDDARIKTYVDALRNYSKVAVDVIRPTEEALLEFPFNAKLRHDILNPTACDFSSLFRQYHGFVLSGGKPNVMPHFYGEEPGFDDSLHDNARDEFTIGLVRQAPAKTPILGICLGMQHIAVAHGAKLKTVDAHGPVSKENAYAAAHGLKIKSSTILHALQSTAGQIFGRDVKADIVARAAAKIKRPPTVAINSVHWRAIDEASIAAHPTAHGHITVMAHAPDDTIEAIHINGTNMLGVQNHPEKDVATNGHSRRLFAAFGMIVYNKLDLRDPEQFASFPKRFILRQRIAARSVWGRLMAAR